MADPGAGHRMYQGLYHVAYGRTGTRPRWKMRLMIRDPHHGNADVILSKDEVQKILTEVAVNDPEMLDEAVRQAAPRRTMNLMERRKT